MLSMFAQYLQERENKAVLETEYGFATYGFNCLSGLDFPHVYICDIFVLPQHRKENRAREMADEIARLSQARGIKIMLGSVDVAANGSDTSLQVLTAYGMKLYNVNGNTIFMIKDLK